MNTIYSPETTAIVERDLSSIPDYSQLSYLLTETVREFGDANTACAALGGAGLRRLFAETSPKSFARHQARRRFCRPTWNWNRCRGRPRGQSRGSPNEPTPLDHTS
jgi:hypothetical protein